MASLSHSAALLLVCLAALAATALGQAALEQPLEPSAALQGTAMVGQLLSTPDSGCGLPAPSSWAGQAALSPNSSLALQASPLSGCGTCLEIQSAAGPSALVVITGVCSSCSASQLTLDAATLAGLAGSNAGPLNVSYRPAECRPPPGTNITITVLDYRASEGGWLRLALGDVAGAGGVDEVELRQTPLAVGGRLDPVASTWRRLHNSFGAVWEVSGVPLPPLDLRITDRAGRQALARKVIWQAGRVGTFSSTAQFPLEGSAAALAAAASSALLDPAAAAAAALPTNASYDSAADGAFDELSALMDEEEASAAAAPSPAAEAPAPADSAAPGAPCNATLLGVLASHKSLSTLVALIRTAGVEGAFASDVPTTVFAPSNAAWERALTRLPLLRFDPDALRAVLLQHVLVGAPTFGVLQTRYDTLSGSTLAIRRAAPNATNLLVVSAGSAAAVDATQRLAACGGSVVFGPTSTVLLPPLASRRRLLMRRSLA